MVEGYEPHIDPGTAEKIESRLNEKPCDNCNHGRSLHRDQGSYRGSECFVENCPCLEWSYNETYAENLRYTRYDKMVDPQGRALNVRREILEEAERLVNGDRQALYGSPEVSFGRIADLLNAMGWRRIDQPASEGADHEVVLPLTAVDAALGLTQLKVSRIISSPDHRDSWVDAAGYIGLGGEMATRHLDVVEPSDQEMPIFWESNIETLKEAAEPHPEVIHFESLGYNRKLQSRLFRCQKDGMICLRNEAAAHVDMFHGKSVSFYVPSK